MKPPSTPPYLSLLFYTISVLQPLTNLAIAVQKAGNASAVYNFTEIPPVNDESGGEHGGNIRNAYLYALTISQTIASLVRS